MNPNPGEQQYLDLLAEVLGRGARKSDRTGTGTLSVFGRQLRFALGESFPLLTTKKLHLKSILYELLWFLRGDTNVKWLQERGVSIWDEWADARGELGPVYGYQWRHWRSADGREIDQIAQVIESLRRKPDSRRHIVTAWNPADVERMALPPCHALFQFYVAEGRLSCQMYQRSADLFLGVPFNIASYAALTLMVAQVTGLEPGEFVLTLGDAHLYLNHLEQARSQIARAPRPFPRMRLNPAVKELLDFKYEDFTLEDYGVPQQFLHGPDVVSGRQKVRRETVPQDMRRNRLGDPGGATRGRDRALDDLLVEMMAADDPVQRVSGAAAGRKDVLPRPAATGLGIFARERERQVDFAESLGKVLLVQRAHLREMRAQRLQQPLRQHRAPVLRPLAVAHRDFPALEVHVLHAQPQTFQQPHPRAVEKRSGQPLHTVEPGEQGPHLVLGQDHRHMLRALRAHHAVQPGQLQRQNFAIKKKQRR